MSALNFDKLFLGAIPEGETGPVGLFQKGYNGAVMAVSYAEILLNRALAKSGPEQPVSYPNTGYFLPVFMALSGEQITKLGEIPTALNRMRAQVKPVFTFEQARLNGEATLYAAEVIEIINYLEGNNPQAEPWTGFLEDPVFRQYGIKMVDWTIPGVAIIIGRAKDSKLAAKIVGSLMSQGMMLFLCDEIVEQLLEENVKLGVDYIAFPVGNFTQVVH
ncbi:MAG: CO dehydrogenase/CO-methylating acetyl-CoA synthase complex subunit beta, partial [Heliobacteriaceae bacterium]|nr:CO dehydrogenase/CO-methylating acetyl-CoA synthase complex subunit beta [Heliobacteriaceae bacterium]